MAFNECIEGELRKEIHCPTVEDRLARLEEGMRRLAHNQVTVDENINNKANAMTKELTGRRLWDATLA